MRPNPQVPVNLITFTEGFYNEKFHFLRSVQLVLVEFVNP